MNKTFCDACETQMPANSSDGTGVTRIDLRGGALKEGGVEFVQVALLGVVGGAQIPGDYCKHCIIDAINTADDRAAECN